MSKELTTTHQTLATREEPSIGAMLHTFIEKGVTAENVSALDQLCRLKERMDERDAERKFNGAFVALQSDMPVIVASSVIPNRGKYERFEDVMRVVGPLLQSHGFAVSFEQKADDKRITVTCHLRHIAGHSSSTPFSVRLGGRADSETQADCKASTTAKRNALLQALNIVIRQDIYQSDEADATMEGGTITADQALDLRALCEEVKADKKKFLEFAGAESFETIATARFSDLLAMLQRKQREAR